MYICMNGVAWKELGVKKIGIYEKFVVLSEQKAGQTANKESE